MAQWSELCVPDTQVTFALSASLPVCTHTHTHTHTHSQIHTVDTPGVCGYRDTHSRQKKTLLWMFFISV